MKNPVPTIPTKQVDLDNILPLRGMEPPLFFSSGRLAGLGLYSKAVDQVHLRRKILRGLAAI